MSGTQKTIRLSTPQVEEEVVTALAAACRPTGASSARSLALSTRTTPQTGSTTMSMASSHASPR
jgi:hypothetical protein